jgi:REP element-mobilizing transposase RayT
MPRKPRVETVGYYHIVNRGVEQRKVFVENKDYEYFLELLCTYAPYYNITLHNYCLMSNHYHLLLEISEPTLSKFMRQINSNYAIYFNKKYKRVGHLWQGRFKSWVVANDAYLYTLMLYIEQNPLKAKVVKKLEEYPYSSAYYFLQGKPTECLRNAWVAQHYTDPKEIKAFLNSSVDSTQLQELKKASSLVEALNVENKLDLKALEKRFQKIKGIKQRNQLIVEAYKEGYSQYNIATIVGVSQPAINGVIKRNAK